MRMFILFSTHRTRYQQRTRPASPMAYLARSVLYIVWRDIGTQFGFTPMRTGANVLGAELPKAGQLAKNRLLTNYKFCTGGSANSQLVITLFAIPIACGPAGSIPDPEMLTHKGEPNHRNHRRYLN